MHCYLYIVTVVLLPDQNVKGEIKWFTPDGDGSRKAVGSKHMWYTVGELINAFFTNATNNIFS